METAKNTEIERLKDAHRRAADQLRQVGTARVSTHSTQPVSGSQMVERKKIAGEGAETGAGLGGIQSRPVRFSSRLCFSSFPPSESLDQATFDP